MQQKEVYDRRTSMEKSARAVKLTATIAERSVGSNPVANLDQDRAVVPELGDIVALVEDGSTRASPRILLGKVLRVNLREREVLLAHLEKKETSKYKLVVGQSTWVESFDALVYPVDVVYDIQGTYTLRSDPLEIHKIVNKNL